MTNERVERLEEQMVKVENVLVLFNERWHAIGVGAAAAAATRRCGEHPVAAARHGVGDGTQRRESQRRESRRQEGGSVGRGPGGGVGMPMLPGEAGRGGGGSPCGADVGGGGGGGDSEALARAPRRPCAARH